MPPAPVPKNQKVKNTLTAIRENGWRSVGEFLLALFSCNDPDVKPQVTGFFTYFGGREYKPERVLESWQKCVPHGDSAEKLKSVLVVAATSIVGDEIKAACRDNNLKKTASKLTISQLSPQKSLEDLSYFYEKHLPNTWRLVIGLLTAENDYEKYKHTQRDGKSDMAKRVSSTHNICASVFLR